MRNFVAKNDFNRASVHVDKKKESKPLVELENISTRLKVGDKLRQLEYGDSLLGTVFSISDNGVYLEADNGDTTYLSFLWIDSIDCEIE